MNPHFVKQWLFPLHEQARGRPTLNILADLRVTETYTPERLKELQWNKLKALLHHAFKSTFYYRELFEKLGVHPADIRNPADFASLPILTKAIIGEHGKNLISKDYLSGRHLIKSATGGSTGEPLMFFTTVRREAALNAAKLRGRSWWGIEMGDRGLDFWHTGRGWGWKERLLYLRDASLNLRAVSAYDLSENAMRRNLAIMKKWRPRFLYVYPSAFFHFTLYLKDQGIDPREFAPEVIFCSAENLFDIQRSLFSVFYGANVVNEYGSHDAGLIAFECPAGKLHLNQEQVYVEVVPDGELHDGKLFITDLENFGQPFIRYQIGDYGEFSSEKCPCGRGLAVLHRVLGRAAEMLRSTRGESVPGLVLTGLFREIPGAREFQVIQETTDSLRIRIVKNGLFKPESQRTIERSLKRYLGHDMKCAFEFPEGLERRPSGKCSWFISRINKEQQEPI